MASPSFQYYLALPNVWLGTCSSQDAVKAWRLKVNEVRSWITEHWIYGTGRINGGGGRRSTAGRMAQQIGRGAGLGKGYWAITASKAGKGPENTERGLEKRDEGRCSGPKCHRTQTPE